MKKNILKLYLINFFSNLTFSSVTWFIYLGRNGLSLFAITVLQSILNLGMLLFEVPTGIYADKNGRKSSLVLGFLLIFLQLIAIVILPSNFILMILVFLLAGIGYALLSGTLESILYESLEDQSCATKTFGIFNGIGYFSLIIGMITGGFIDQISGKGVFLATSAVVLISLLISTLLKESDKTSGSYEVETIGQHLMNFLTVLKEQILNFPLFFSFSMIVALVSLYYLFAQETFNEINIPTYIIGVIFGVSHLIEGSASFTSHKIEKILGITKTFKISLLLLSFFFTFLIFESQIFTVIAFLGVNMVFGILDPMMTSIINNIFVSKHRTALNSTYNFISSVLMFIFSPLIGLFTQYMGHSLSIIIASMSLISIFLIILSYLLFSWKMKKNA